ncbi:hypothetical protein BH10CYA1_BH10CYA1_26720 [soil metagenome]
MAECTGGVRKLGSAATSGQTVAEALVNYFYNELVSDKAGTKACSLVRMFRTRAYSQLSARQKSCADSSQAAQFCFPTTKCLTLEATAGDQVEWNSVSSSRGHQAIPLPSEELVRQMPMISQLISDLGLRVSDVLEPPKDLFIGKSEEDYNIFLVPDAVGSAIISAQDEFVVPNKIRSVLGYGGMMTTGDMFAVILFSKLKIRRDTADMFRCIALATNLAVMRFDVEPMANPIPPTLRLIKPREGSG